MKIAGLGTFSKIFAYLGDSENKNSGTIPRANKIHICIFFHPDYTVGFGLTPNHALRLAGYTAGRDFHPALKIIVILLTG